LGLWCFGAASPLPFYDLARNRLMVYALTERSCAVDALLRGWMNSKTLLAVYIMQRPLRSRWIRFHSTSPSIRFSFKGIYLSTNFLLGFLRPLPSRFLCFHCFLIFVFTCLRFQYACLITVNGSHGLRPSSSICRSNDKLARFGGQGRCSLLSGEFTVRSQHDYCASG
jgi:hypothetical protein